MKHLLYEHQNGITELRHEGLLCLPISVLISVCLWCLLVSVCQLHDVSCPVLIHTQSTSNMLDVTVLKQTFPIVEYVCCCPGTVGIKLEQDDHRTRERELRDDKRSLKVCYVSQLQLNCTLYLLFVRSISKKWNWLMKRW